MKWLISCYWITQFLLRIRFIACICRFLFFYCLKRLPMSHMFDGYRIFVVIPFPALWVCPYKSFKKAHFIFTYTMPIYFRKVSHLRGYLGQMHNLVNIPKDFGLFTENKRVISIISTSEFGKVSIFFLSLLYYQVSAYFYFHCKYWINLPFNFMSESYWE